MNRRLRRVYQIRAWCPKVNRLRHTSLAVTWRRKSVVASLFVLALIVSGVGIWKLLGYMEWLNGRKVGEESLRRECRKIGFWWNFSSISGFDLGYRGGERMLALLRGETGSIELIINGNTWNLSEAIGKKLYEACEMNLYGTLDGSGSRAILPPGVRAEFTPPNITLPAGGNVSILQTITVDQDAPTGCYGYGVGIRISNGTYFGASFWLVIGPYTPHGNFSLVVGYGEYMEDFIARDELNVSLKVGAEVFGGAYSFNIRSEGPPLNVTLEVVNVDMPEGVKLSVPQQVFVPEGSQAMVVVEIGTYANLEVGRTYHFKVICRSGNEKHIANYNYLVYNP